MTLTLPLAVKANEQGLPERCGQGRGLCVFSVCVCVGARRVSISLRASGSYCMEAGVAMATPLLQP